MKNNSLAIIKVILLSIIALMLTLILVILISKPTSINLFNRSMKTSLIYDEDIVTPINNININTISADIQIRETNQEKINMKIYSTNKDDITYSTNNETLEIKDKTNYSCIGFCTSESNSIIIDVPKDSKYNLEITTISGDVTVASNLNITTTIKTTSGDINLNDAKKAELNTVSGDVKVNKVGTLNLKTTSGEIEITSIEKSCEIKTTSGDIEIDKVILENNSKIESKSGDIEISETNSYIVTETTSGEIQTSNNNRYSKTELYIKTISGDIVCD